MNKIGNLHLVKQDYWLVFSSKDAAAHFTSSIGVKFQREVEASKAATYWSEQLNCNVTYVSPNDIFVLLETDGRCKKVLTSNGEVGWAAIVDCYNDYFEEVRAE